MKIAQFMGTGIPSDEIRFLTRSIYSHSAFILDEGSAAAVLELNKRGTPLRNITFSAPGSVVEAWMPVVRNTSSISDGHKSGEEVHVFDLKVLLTLDEEMALLQFLDDQIGWPYDSEDVLRFVTKRPGDLDHAWFCSELVFASLQKIGRLLMELTLAWEVPPDWIPRSVLVNPAYQRLTT